MLNNARIVETLDEALDGMVHLCATAMTPRDFGPPTLAPYRTLPSCWRGPKRYQNRSCLRPSSKRSSPIRLLFCSVLSVLACKTTMCTAAMPR